MTLIQQCVTGIRRDGTAQAPTDLRAGELGIVVPNRGKSQQGEAQGSPGLGESLSSRVAGIQRSGPISSERALQDPREAVRDTTRLNSCSAVYPAAVAEVGVVDPNRVIQPARSR